MRCPNCNCDVPEGSLFCPECGQKLEGVNGSQAENSGETYNDQQQDAEDVYGDQQRNKEDTYNDRSEDTEDSLWDQPQNSSDIYGTSPRIMEILMGISLRIREASMESFSESEFWRFLWKSVPEFRRALSGAAKWREYILETASVSE